MKFLTNNIQIILLLIFLACLFTRCEDQKPCIDCEKQNTQRDTIFLSNELERFFPDSKDLQWIYEFTVNDKTFFDTVTILKSYKEIRSDWTIRNSDYEVKFIERIHSVIGVGNVNSLTEELEMNSLHGSTPQIVNTNYWEKLFNYPIYDGYNEVTDSYILTNQKIQIFDSTYSGVLQVVKNSDTLWFKSGVGLIQKSNSRNEHLRLIKLNQF